MEFTDNAVARPFLEAIVQVIRPLPRALGLAWLSAETATLHRPTTVADFQFPLELLEYSCHSLRWPEGKEMLIQTFGQTADLSHKLSLELMIKRLYDLAWDGGDIECTDRLGPSIWD